MEIQKKSNLHFLLSPRGMLRNALRCPNCHPLRLCQLPFPLRLEILTPKTEKEPIFTNKSCIHLHFRNFKIFSQQVQSLPQKATPFPLTRDPSEPSALGAPSRPRAPAITKTNPLMKIGAFHDSEMKSRAQTFWRRDLDSWSSFDLGPFEAMAVLER